MHLYSPPLADGPDVGDDGRISLASYAEGCGHGTEAGGGAICTGAPFC
jgi:hypothetical protein